MHVDIIEKDGVFCPTVYCDYCHRPLRSGQNGMVKWSRKDADHPIPFPVNDIVVCHKGRCDTQTRGGHDWQWHELDVFLVYLMNNARVDLPDARARAAILARV